MRINKKISFWKDKSLWVYEIGLTVIFLIVAILAFVRNHDFQNSLFFFVKIFLLMQPVIFVAHFFDIKYRRR